MTIPTAKERLHDKAVAEYEAWTANPFMSRFRMGLAKLQNAALDDALNSHDHAEMRYNKGRAVGIEEVAALDVTLLKDTLDGIGYQSQADLQGDAEGSDGRRPDGSSRADERGDEGGEPVASYLAGIYDPAMPPMPPVRRPRSEGADEGNGAEDGSS